MICGALVASSILATAQLPGRGIEIKPGANPEASTAADRITLYDGSIVLGMVESVSSGTRGAVDFHVRRAWARQHLPKWAARWERAVESGSHLAVRQRGERLASWREQRGKGKPQDDRILAWIDRERDRLKDPETARQSVLIPVHLPRNEVRSLVRAAPPQARLLQLGWLCGLRDVETLSLDALKDTLEGRGFSPEGANTPSIAGLLPLMPEPEIAWLARRAATEVALDDDLRFVRHRDMVFADVQGGQGQGLGLDGIGLPAMMGELRRLIEPDTAREDPLVATFRKIGEGGRVGAVVTRLDLAEDFGQASVESTLWVETRRENWIPFVRRSSTVRPDEIVADAGRDLAEDPQVKSAFSLMEGLGLGKVSQEMKDRSLKIGAATQQALGNARAALSQDLNRLMLPIFEIEGQAPEPLKDRAGGKPPARGSADPAPSRRATAPGVSRNPL